ncbi:alpha/beta hydrolase family protein [Lunatibacter salilacus]|uniref:alpha/beta hydrolase family protein n=1 Tax=Lunatibacter salilacus TaxID=2483804 RepID=UPI00131E5A6E|nr:alpha/beta hydrolase [Lunatibacter salilacus]
MKYQKEILLNLISQKQSAFGALVLFLFFSYPLLGQSIREEKYVSIGRIEQWVTISGLDKSNPVILILHGGPGSPVSPYSNAIFGNWENEFVIVNWDQRGSGRTFGRNIPANVDKDYWIENPLRVDQMVADGIELAEYLLKKLDKEKIILMGSSWGSVLGAKMALKRPDLFYAYIGHSQLVNPVEDLKIVYRKLHSLALEQEDNESINTLKSLGKPPYDNARDMGKLMQLIKKYEGKNAIPAPNSWWNPADDYNNTTDAQHREDGDDYSFINYVGHAQLGIKAMSATVDFMEDGLFFEIPIFLVQGEKDILTPAEISKAYFDKIKAPNKEFFIISGASHGFNQAVVDMHYSILQTHILPEIK